MLIAWVLNLGSRASLSARKKQPTHSKKTRGGNMKKLLALAVLALCMSAPLFGADVVGHSVEVAGKDSYKAVDISAKAAGKSGKDSYKAVKFSARETGHAGKAFVKFLF
jgi:hypothetical protein